MPRRTKLVASLGVALALAFAGCQNKSAEQSTEQSSAPGSQPARTGTQPGGLKHRAKEGSKTGALSKVETITVPSGTELDVRLSDTIDTGRTSEGAAFQGTLASPLTVNGVEIAPINSSVTGRVTHVVSSGRLNRPAELSLTLTSLTLPGGQAVDITTSTWREKAASHKKRDAEMIGGGAGVGALIGALAGKGKGAAIGAAVGAGAGTAGAAITGKKEIVLGPETRLTFKLATPLTLTRTKS